VREGAISQGYYSILPCFCQGKSFFTLKKVVEFLNSNALIDFSSLHLGGKLISSLTDFKDK